MIAVSERFKGWEIKSRVFVCFLQKFVDLYPHRKITPKPPKMGIFETESDIKWRIILQRNFTSTIAALVHYEEPSSVNPQKRVNFDQKLGTSLSGILTPQRKIWDSLISLELWEIESWNFTHISMGQVLFSGMKIFPLGACGGGAQRPYCKFGTSLYLGNY